LGGGVEKEAAYNLSTVVFLTVGYGVTANITASTSVVGLGQTQKEEPLGIRILGRDSMAGVDTNLDVWVCHLWV